VTDTSSNEPLDGDDAPRATQPSTTAIEMFQRALEIRAAKANIDWEPNGRRIEYITIEIALMRELTGSVWGISVLDVDEREAAPPAWLTNPWNIESWQRAIDMRRALLDAVGATPSPRYNSQ
jgi:regulator of protease activity HflC (stomatin/prohibitin superfamily)